MEISKLYKIAAGLNIEGGFPFIDLYRDYKKCIWANLILVLDRPLIDKIIFDDLFANNKYPLLESAIDNLNEHNFLAAYLMIICYYFDNGRKILNKKENDVLYITVHIHQDITAMPLINLLDEYLDKLTKICNIDVSNSKINYETDNKTYINSSHRYSTDILISLGQCAGLHPDLEPGVMIIADEFIPYHINTNTVNLFESYFVENSLVKDFDLIYKSKYNKSAVEFINNNYISANPNKHNDKAYLNWYDFHYEKILQVNKLWNPTNDKELVTVIKQ